MAERRLQEIVTRAVVGRAERRITWSHTVPAEGITGVFGVHVTNAAVAVSEKDGNPVVDLAVDCDLWCGTQTNTEVIRCSASARESVPIRTVGKVMGDAEVSVRLAGAPKATRVKVDEGVVTLFLEATVVVEMSALARMWVEAYHMDDEELLEDLDDVTSGSSDSSSGSNSGE